MRKHLWENQGVTDSPYSRIVSDRCSTCGVKRQIETTKDAYGIPNGTSVTRYMGSGHLGWDTTDTAPPCLYEIAAPLEPESSREGKAIPFGATYASLSAYSLTVAQCWVDCPDGKRRQLSVVVSPSELLQWAIAHLPYNSSINGDGERKVAWSKLEE